MMASRQGLGLQLPIFSSIIFCYLQLVIIHLNFDECRGFFLVAPLRLRLQQQHQLDGSSLFLPLQRSPKRTVTANNGIKNTRLFMGDRSCATRFQVGDIVTVTEDVMKAGENLRGLSGTVIETWEKCDVDPTCCCAEWVDEGLSVHVRFNASRDNDIVDGDNSTTFIHYFAESELVKKKEDSVGSYGDDKTNRLSEGMAFDGLSCKVFKLDKLSMGEQARRIKA
eukprot:CAMPEP_0181120222 /NCGR_PEP_ID=MMETSP1071-20121207/24037_1 /TAXON_ID=35127 /ORGANISM="Thalassiosira sp., Strain NH16" /LENGTH=223 /DNA_ID=CAMNT_0023204855 /DNA_START=88 /DNA_END=756 /DNA_ORIENTATION=-